MRWCLMMIWGAVMMGSAVAATPIAEDSWIDRNPEASVALRAQAEVGALYPIVNIYQVGQNGTEVSIPNDLGQENLFPFLYDAVFSLSTRIGGDRARRMPHMSMQQNAS